MNRKFTKIFTALTIFILNNVASYAQITDTNNSSFAVGAKLGTTGVGIEAMVPITERFYGRFGVNYFHYHHNRHHKVLTNNSLHYKAKLTLLTIPVMLDYHPFDNSGFRLSAGIAYNGNKLTANAKPSNNITLYGHTYTLGELGTVKSTLTLGKKIVPIVTIGYDSSFFSNKPWSFNAEAGVIYSGKAKIKVSTTGIGANNTQLIDDINQDANKHFKKERNLLKFFPIITIGFKYNF
jgi:hypothetical protein